LHIVDFDEKKFGKAKCTIFKNTFTFIVHEFNLYKTTNNCLKYEK